MLANTEIQYSHRHARETLGISNAKTFKSYLKELRVGRYISQANFHRIQELHYYCRETRGSKVGGIVGYRSASPERRKAVAIAHFRKIQGRPANGITRSDAMKRLGIGSWATMARHCQRMGLPKGFRLTEAEVARIGRMHRWTTRRMGGPGGPGHQRRSFLLHEERQAL